MDGLFDSVSGSLDFQRGSGDFAGKFGSSRSKLEERDNSEVVVYTKVEERQNQKSVSLVSYQDNGDGTVNPEVEVANSEVKYIESENLSDVKDVETTVKTLLAGLDSKNWVSVCDSLNDVCRLSIYHQEAVLDMPGEVIPLMVKSLNNPRSAVCKTAIMTSADEFHAYNDHIVESLDPLLGQLLLNSSQDRKFVCEAAERALVAMTTWVFPTLLLPKLQLYFKHRNPRIRAKASMCFSRSVLQLGVEGIKAYGIILVGHSMGASVAVRVATWKTLPCLAGLVVIDVVEGTSLASLVHMQKILSSRMQHFFTVDKAIERSVKGGSLRKIEKEQMYCYLTRTTSMTH